MVKRHPLYRRWGQMIARCENPKAIGYKNYGGRGLSVCARWRTSFNNFLADMGPWSEGMTIDRINNDGNYEPSNCRWANMTEQARNRRTSRKVMFQGQMRNFIEIAGLIGVSHSKVSKWSKRGFDIQAHANRLLEKRHLWGRTTQGAK